MWRALDRITETPAGSFLYRKAARPLLAAYRSRTSPGLPPTQRDTQVECNGNSVTMRHYRQGVGAGFEAVKQCFIKRQYDFPAGIHGQLTQQRYQDMLAAGITPLIVDCGANIGASAVWFSLRYPEAHIVAVEPAPDNCQLLRHNSSGRNIEVHEAGVAPADGVAHLDDSHGRDMGYRTSEQPGTGPAIPMISVASLLAAKDTARFAPFLLKIDIEGFEKQLFAADCSAIDRFPLILLELHDWLLPGQQTSNPFFRFQAATGREFCMRDENIASIAHHPSLLAATGGFSNGEITLP